MRECCFCKSNLFQQLYIKDNFIIIRCLACDFIYVGNPPPESQMSKYYQKEYYQGSIFKDYLGEKEIKIKYFIELMQRIRNFIPSGKLLDIGCAAGFLLESAKKYFDVYGLELSNFSANYARNELGHKVFAGNLPQANYPADFFDCITMIDVIEHVYNPAEYLKEIWRILRKEGVLIISTGDASSINSRIKRINWELLSPPWHLSYFTRRCLIKQLIRTGFTIVKFETNDNLVGANNPLFFNYFTQCLTRFFKLGDIVIVYLRK